MSFEYVANTRGTAAVRKDKVMALFISNPSEGQFHLNLRTENFADSPPNMAFEEDITLGGIQAKAQALIEQLST